MSKTKEDKHLASPLDFPLKKNEGVVSVNLNFEDCLIESSKRKSSYTSEWIEAEIKKSSSYFTKEIYNEG